MNKSGLTIFETPLGKAGLKDQHGTIVLAPEYDKILDYDDDGYIRVLKGKVYGTVDFAGNIVIPHDKGLTHLGVFYEGTTRARRKGKWGLVDIHGDDVTEFCYEEIYAHRKYGYHAIKTDGTKGILKENGTFVPENGAKPKKPKRKPKQKVSVFSEEKFNENISYFTGGWSLRPLKFCCRDTDADINVKKIYKMGTILRSGDYLMATDRLLRSVHRTRFLIASVELFNSKEKLEFEEDYRERGRLDEVMRRMAKYEGIVLMRNAFFMVMDVFTYACVTQVVLLQLPIGAITAAKKFGVDLTQIKAYGPEHKSLKEFARNDLKRKMGQEIHGHSLADKWVERMWQPVGLTADLKPEDLAIDESGEGDDFVDSHYWKFRSDYEWTDSALTVEEWREVDEETET